MDLTWCLKLLSGQLAGVEYTLALGDAVFCMGSRRDLVDGVIGETLARADNTYYIPFDGASSAFVIRIAQGDDGVEIHLGERDSEALPWQFTPLKLNTPVPASGLHLAVRPATNTWSAAVRNFAPPSGTLSPVAGRKGIANNAVGSWRRRALAGVAMVAAIGGGIWFAGIQADRQRVASASRLLANSPFDIRVLSGQGGALHVLGDSAKSVAWARRAVARTPSLPDITYTDLTEARHRTYDVLEKAGFDVAVIRFSEPAAPEVVVVSDEALQPHLAAALRARVMQTLAFATDVKVTTVTLGRLENLARAELASMNIATRTRRDGSVSIISNDGYLDDAGLNAVRAASARFADMWGTRRVAIHARLWDDLLKGRSYQYHPNQLLSVGQGRWEFSSTGRAN